MAEVLATNLMVDRLETELIQHKNHSVDLWSPSDFQIWFANAVEHDTVEDLAAGLLDLDTEISRCRAMCIAYFGADRALWQRLSEQVIYSNVKVIEYYARALRLYQVLYQDRNEGKNSAYTGATNTLPLFKSLLDKLEKEDSTPFRREVECALRTAYSDGLRMEGWYEEAEAQVVEALDWARTLRAPICRDRARTQLLGLRQCRGAVSDAITLIKDVPLDDTRSPPVKAIHENILAFSLAHLGAHKAGFEVLEAVDVGKIKSKTPMVNIFKQQFKCLMGSGGLDGPILTNRPPEPCEYSWVTKGLRALSQVHSVPRQAKQFKEDSARNTFLQTVIDTCLTEYIYVNPWYELLQSWMLSTAYLWKGRQTDALAVVSRVTVPSDEWLDLRILFAGLKLELAMDLVLHDYQPQAAEAEIRAVMSKAREIPLASAEGLAIHLKRWHPAAATYMTVVPDPLPEMGSASQGILDTHLNEAYGIQFPPVLACELVLRSLDLDLYGLVSDVDIGKRRGIRESLRTMYGEVPYYLPVLSAVKLANALFKYDSNSYDSKAFSLLVRYGITPSTSADHPMRDLIKKVEDVTKDLMDKQITTKDFRDALLAL